MAGAGARVRQLTQAPFMEGVRFGPLSDFGPSPGVPMALAQWVVVGSMDPDDVGLAVARWLRAARHAAEHETLTGGMLFDGERWIQLLEGTAVLTAELVRVLQQGGALGVPTTLRQVQSGTGQRACTQWRSAYVEPAVIDALQRAIEAGVMLAILAAFVGALEAADAF
ncbi:MAG: hypothetical protein ABI696_17935 [Rubrivivax sp.]